MTGQFYKNTSNFIFFTYVLCVSVSTVCACSCRYMHFCVFVCKVHSAAAVAARAQCQMTAPITLLLNVLQPGSLTEAGVH